jgi:hypothetical protein
LSTLLLHCLLDETGKSRHEIAKELGYSESCLSRHSTGVLAKRSVLAKLAKYLSEIHDTCIDADLLTLPLNAKILVAFGIYVRDNSLTSKRKEQT